MRRNFKIFCFAFLFAVLIDLICEGFQISNLDVIDFVTGFLFNSLFAATNVWIYGEITKEMAAGDAMMLMQDQAVNIVDMGGVIIGKLGKYKRFFIGDLLYDKERGTLTGPGIIMDKSMRWRRHG